jgi:hypothetical protein
LRIVARKSRGLKLSFNDYLIFWALFWATSLVISDLVGLLYGIAGHHASEIVAIAPERIKPFAVVRFPVLSHDIH